MGMPHWFLQHCMACQARFASTPLASPCHIPPPPSSSAQEEKSEKLKVKKAIEKGNMDGAKVWGVGGAVPVDRKRSRCQDLSYSCGAAWPDIPSSTSSSPAPFLVHLIHTPPLSPLFPQIYAQNAIRKKTESLNYMKLASRLDAVVSRLDTQAKMQMVGKVWRGYRMVLSMAWYCTRAYVPRARMCVCAC